MKKTILYMLSAVLLSVGACKEEHIQPYSGSTHIFFAPGKDKKEQLIDFSFAYFPTHSDTLVPIQVILWGGLFKEDTGYQIIAGSNGNARKDIDYSFQAQSIFRKAAAVDTFYVMLHKTPELTQGQKTLHLEVEGAARSGSGIYRSVTIRLSDSVSKPQWWTTATKFNSLGAYSDIKYRQLIIFKGKNFDLTNESSFAISTMAKEFKAYLLAQWNLGNRIYAEDGQKPLHETLGV